MVVQTLMQVKKQPLGVDPGGMQVLASLILYLIAVASAANSSITCQDPAVSASLNTNILSALVPADTFSQCVSLLPAVAGSAYVVGTIESSASNASAHPFATVDPGDSLGRQDLFLVKLNAENDIIWTRRFGSRGRDYAHGAALDGEGNVFIVGSVGAAIGDQQAGVAVFKYTPEGDRSWVRTYGLIQAGDEWRAVVSLDDHAELLVAGTIGAKSPLYGNETRPDISRVAVARLHASNGTLIKLEVVGPSDSAHATVGNSLKWKKGADGRGRVFVGGASISSDVAKVSYAALFSMRYPSLELISIRIFDFFSGSAFASLALSLNGHSVYAGGSRYSSIYSESDVLLARSTVDNLTVHWNFTLGSGAFPDQASIGNAQGSFSEAAVAVSVDKFGNIYTLLDATGTLLQVCAYENLRNSRPAVIVFAPNGSEVYRLQSAWEEPTVPEMMVTREEETLVCGQRLNNGSKLEQAYVGVLRIPVDVYQKHAEEYAPLFANMSISASTQTTNQAGNKGVVGGAVGGAAAVVVGVAVVGLMLVRSRASRDQKRTDDR